jgi:hypothetical protein
LQLLIPNSWLEAKSTELNVRSPLFAGFCHFDQQIQFNCCLYAKTGDGVSLKIKKGSEAVI